MLHNLNTSKTPCEVRPELIDYLLTRKLFDKCSEFKFEEEGCKASYEVQMDKLAHFQQSLLTNSIEPIGQTYLK